jgi:hypothetical protein
MATITKKSTDATETPGKPGRKPKPREDFDYSRTKQAFRRPADFAAYLAGYPDFRAVQGYWYRLKPRINLGLIGIRDNFIHKALDTTEMTEEFCARRWGRGVYMLKLSDGNRKTGEQEVARAWFTCDDPDLDPVYDPRTLLLNDPDNADEVTRLVSLGVIKRDGEGPARVRTEHVAVTPVVAPVPVTTGLTPGIGDQIMLKLLERALPSATPQTASDVLEQSFQIADRLRPALVPALTPPTLDQIADAVALRMRPATPVATTSVASEIETWERVSGLLDKIGAGRAIDGGSTPAWVTLLAPMLQNIVQPLVPLLVGYLSRPAAAGPGPQTVHQNAQIPAAPAAPAAAPYPTFLPATAPLMDRVIQVAQLALGKSAEGVDGFFFASWVCGYYPGGEEVYRFLESSGGTNGCLGLMSMVPDLKAQLADPARVAALEAWLNDFFSYEPGQAETEEEPAAA